MLIILEGAEKSGKTTLAKRLCDTFGFEYLHHGVPTHGVDYAKQLLGLTKPTVMDRSFLGEVVYGPLLRKKCLLSREHLHTLWRLAAKLDTMFIECRLPLVRKYQLDAKDLAHGIDYQLNKQVDAEFVRALESTKAYCETAPYCGDSLKDIDLFVDVHYHELNNRAKDSDPRTWASGVGTLKPKLVLVGEQINQNVTWAGLPFDAGSAASYLNKVLAISKIPSNEVYLMNCKLLNGRHPGMDEMRRLTHNFDDSIKLVAMGNEACRWLSKLGHKFYKVEHPQYRKRFKTHQTGEYVRLLEDIYHD